MRTKKPNPPDLSTIQGAAAHFLILNGIPLTDACERAGVARSVFYYTKDARINLKTLMKLSAVAGVKVSDVILLWEANQKKEEKS